MEKGRRAYVEARPSRCIRVDDEVYRWLQSQAVAFKDTPNTVLWRIMLAQRKKKSK